MQLDDKLLCSPEEKVQREIANQAGVIEYLADFVAKRRTRITESDLLQIHALTIEGIYPCAGYYRHPTTRGEITATDPKPSHPPQLRLDTLDRLDWLYHGRRNFSPVDRACCIPFHLNPIHPINCG